METTGAMEEIPRFAADRMMARLARWLRLLGADVICDQRLDGATMLRWARAEGRMMLTRDKRLRTAPDVLYLEPDDFRAQLRAVLARRPFDVHRHAFTRCSRCNVALFWLGICTQCFTPPVHKCQVLVSRKFHYDLASARAGFDDEFVLNRLISTNFICQSVLRIARKCKVTSTN